MKSANNFSSRPHCNSTAEVPSLILRTDFSAILWVSDLCNFDEEWFPARSLTIFAKFFGMVSVNDFWFRRRPQELLRALLRFLRCLCFTSVWLYPLCCQVLYHYSVSMIVSRFTSFTENIVIRSCQITKNFRSRHDCTSAVSARSPCNLGSQADIAISVLREVSKNVVLTQYHFCSRLSVFWNTFICWTVPELLQPFWQITQQDSQSFPSWKNCRCIFEKHYCHE